MALFRIWNILLPWAAAPAEPTNKAPTDDIDSSSSALSDDGRKVGACMMGKIGLNFVK